MAAKNYSELIRDKRKRQLTAKGYKFLNRCIEIAAANKGLHRLSPTFKQTKEKLYVLFYDLLIDKEMSITEITELIKSRNFIEQS